MLFADEVVEVKEEGDEGSVKGGVEEGGGEGKDTDGESTTHDDANENGKEGEEEKDEKKGEETTETTETKETKETGGGDTNEVPGAGTNDGQSASSSSSSSSPSNGAGNEDDGLRSNHANVSVAKSRPVESTKAFLARTHTNTKASSASSGSSSSSGSSGGQTGPSGATTGDTRNTSSTSNTSSFRRNSEDAVAPLKTTIDLDFDDGAARVAEGDMCIANARLLPHRGAAAGVSFAPGDYRALTCCWSGEAHVWDTSTGVRLVTTKGGHDEKITACDLSADRAHAATSSADGTVRVWHLITLENRATYKDHFGPVLDCAFAPDGYRVVSCGHDKTARIWDSKNLVNSVHEGTSAPTLLVLAGHEDIVTACSFSRRLGEQVLTCSRDRRGRLWDSTSGELLLTLTGHTAGLTGGAFAPCGEGEVATAVTSSMDKTLRIWNLETGVTRTVLKGHTEWVMGCCFSPNGDTVASCGKDKTLRLWDPDSLGTLRATVVAHEDWAMACGYSVDGQRIMSTGYDGAARVWRLDLRSRRKSGEDDCCQQIEHFCIPGKLKQSNSTVFFFQSTNSSFLSSSLIFSSTISSSTVLAAARQIIRVRFGLSVRSPGSG